MKKIVAFLFLLLLLIDRTKAALIQDAAQCLPTGLSLTSGNVMTQTIYPPSLTLTFWFFAACLGSLEVPQVAGGADESIDFRDVLKRRDCGQVFSGECCRVNENPSEAHYGGFPAPSDKFVQCRLEAQPEQCVQLSCPSPGMLYIQQFSGGGTVVLSVDGHYGGFLTNVAVSGSLAGGLLGHQAT